MWGYLIVPVLLGCIVVVVARLRTAEARRRFLRRSGLVVAAVFTVLGTLWIAGEAFDDPGGWEAVGLVAAWLVPLAVLTVVAWFRVAWAAPLLTAVTVVVIGLNAWVAVDPDPWRTFENDHGPVRAIASFALAAPLAVLGRKRLVRAGTLLVTLAIAPIVFSAIGGVAGAGSLLVASTPLLLTGLLYLAAASTSAHAAAVPTSGRHG